MSGRRDNRRSNGRDEARDDRKQQRDQQRGDERRGGAARSSGGGGSRPGAERAIAPAQPNYENNGGHRSGGGGGGGSGSRVAGLAFNGAAFTESQLMDEVPKKKFTGRCRLFVGNLPNEVKEAELKELFSPHGDIAECYLSGKGFAFLRLDTRAHAESAKEAIDGRIIHGRQVRVRFAVHGAAIRVKELSPTVSNEMLYHAFSHFGDVERAVHIVDEKGRPTGEGIVEFERKPNCNEAMAAIREKVFLLTASPKPLICEVLEPRDEDDGLAERMIPRTPGLSKERELGPRFPTQNSFEYVYGMKWKELYDVEKKRRAALDEELRESRRRLESDMELAYQDYQAQMLREDLQRRQQELERLEAARRERMRGLGGPQGGMPPQVQPFHSQGNFMAGGPAQGPPAPFQQPFQQPPQGMLPTGVPPPLMGAPTDMRGPPGGGYGGPPQGGVGGLAGLAGPGGMLQNPHGRSNMIEGVQRLLQIFKHDNGPAGGMPGRDFPQQGGPMFGGPGGPYGGGGDGGYPPEKKQRR
ncbi:CBN-PSF-1 protein [Caenorhabditis brenneri]|uniref:CBN-PSF-1 protein n=1 Tax=Caenorhabditis brenneri TaxID=135651 RepID=G0MLK0_CAEBE|nr:CBN-PSF-1 protein [Caenorhabditis brenneri]